MKKHTQISMAIMSLLAVFSLVPVSRVAAATSVNLKLDPSSQVVTTGGSVTVKLVAEITDYQFKFYRVAGKINFPKNIVTVTSLSTAGSGFNNGNATSTYDNAAGTITFNRSSYGGSANMLVFTLTFKTLAPGTASLAFDPSASTQTTSLGQLSNGSIVVRNPTCPTGQVGTPPNCTTPTPTPNPTPTPTPNPTPTPTPTPTPNPTPTPTPSSPGTDAALPVLDAAPDMTPVQVDAGDLSIREVSTKPSWKANPISWNLTLADATPTLEIGTSKNALKTNDSVTKQDDGSYIASPKNLTPGVRYYYLITATANNDPLKKATYSGAFTTRGYPTSLVFTHDDKPVTGAKVTIENGSYTTDKNGSIELELSNKQYSASVTTGDGVTEKVQFTVAKKASVNGSDPEKQTFNFTILKENATDQPALPLGLIAATGAGVFVMAASFIGFLLYRRRHAEQLAVPSTFTDEYSWEAPLPENRAMEPQQYTPYPAANLQSPMNSTDQNIVDTEQFNDTPYPQQTIESSAEVLEVPNQIPFEQRYSEPELSVDPLVDELSQPTVSQPQNSIAAEDVNPTTVQQFEQPATVDEPTTDAIYDASTGELDIVHHTPVPFQPVTPHKGDL